MDKLYINSIAPLVKDKLSWDAFINLLEFEQKQLVNKLHNNKDINDLISISSKYSLLEDLKKYRDRVKLNNE